jgi:hypothetical protein
MSDGAIAVLAAAVVILVVAAVILVAMRARRRRRLQERFGPEYERAVSETGNRREAETELAQREKRHDELELRELSAASRSRYATEWRQVQEHFVDAPEKATGEADALITAVMSERGYPTGGYEQQAADLSVEHARTLDHYRRAHEVIALVGQGNASTEDLRQAMVHYRAVFEELIGSSIAEAPAVGQAAVEHPYGYAPRDGEPRDGRLGDGDVRDGRFGDGRFGDGEFRDSDVRDGDVRDRDVRDRDVRDGGVRDGGLPDADFRDRERLEVEPGEVPARDGEPRDGRSGRARHRG